MIYLTVLEAIWTRDTNEHCSSFKQWTINTLINKKRFELWKNEKYEHKAETRMQIVSIRLIQTMFVNSLLCSWTPKQINQGSHNFSVNWAIRNWIIFRNLIFTIAIWLLTKIFTIVIRLHIIKRINFVCNWIG